MILIQNGRVLDPVTNTDQVMDVLLDESGIVKTGEHLEAEGADVIDASGLVVAPGLMDAHVHFRDPGLTYKEDIFTGAAAAARGGFTTWQIRNRRLIMWRHWIWYRKKARKP
mgnify:CR=1 FL=1